MAKRNYFTLSDFFCQKGLDVSKGKKDRQIKKVETAKTPNEGVFAFGKRRCHSFSITNDVYDNIKSPLLSDDFEQTNAHCNRLNREIFCLNDCPCDDVDYIKQLEPFSNIKTIAIVGNLAFSSRQHLTKIFTNSGIKVVAKHTTANCMLLGWWTDVSTLSHKVGENVIIILEEDFMKLISHKLMGRCRHIKYHDGLSLSYPNICEGGQLLKDQLRPTRISQILGHQDVFESLYNFLSSLKRDDADQTADGNTMKKKTCVILYPPGCGIRNGIELICRAMGFYCCYADNPTNVENFVAQKELKFVYVYHRETLDATSLEQIIEINKPVIIMIEDVNTNFMVFMRDQQTDLITSRGTVSVNVPSWITNSAVCITVPPTPDLASHMLIRSILQGIYKESNIDDAEVEAVAKRGTTINGYIDLEKVINFLQFYVVIDKPSRETLYEKNHASYTDISNSFAIRSYERSLQVVEHAYQINSHTKIDWDVYGDVEVRNVTTEQNCPADYINLCETTSISPMNVAMERLLKNEKYMEKLYRKDHIDLIRMRRKLNALVYGPCECYSLINISMV
ncbi:uncharacterized protein BBOV_IV008080 [Babesia bovis T2Bo]|uniref:uncharacterized protein n=1 Tax=Babesia bovis T2Bo TaxID=484906 RepID=UPI001D6BCBB9|nr:uncharacterized protein BBOV_IV008080 [Babesia bovis T2Bo]EDO07162.2 hypothetical protein BBOV_IV008080 [Babesia bovis T2Bo]